MNLHEHLPILVVIIPLLAAPLCILAGRLAAWPIALGSSWLSLAVAVALHMQVLESGEISYTLGGWAAPWGIEYHADLLTTYVLLIVTAIAAIVLSYARLSVQQEISDERQAPFYAALCLCLAGLAGIASTGDAFNLFVFLEISSLSSYALISMGKDRRALNAAFQYLIMGSIGATFILIGIGFLYMMTGTLNMRDLAERLPALYDTRTVRAGLAFLTVGIGLKLALFPLHLWLPNAYAYAPSVVSGLLAATATKVAVYAMLRFMLGIFGVQFTFTEMPLDNIFIALGATAIIITSLVAIFQENIKRLFAYSSVAQIGYMVLGMGLASTTGLTATLLHLFNHALMKGALFLALGAVLYRLGSVELRNIAGLGRRMPWTVAAIVIGGLSVIGVPGTAGFVSKWYLVLATLEQDLWPLAALILLGSFLALAYVWKIVEAAYLTQPTEHAERQTMITEAPLSLLIPVWFLVVANIYFGIHTELTVGVAEQASAILLGTAS